MLLQFDDIQLNVRPHQVHEWALTTAEVAAGFGVSPEAIRSHKSRNADELIEGKHFVSVANCNAVGNQADTWWTKKGVVRLGFFIKSERAKRFRDWSEDLIVKSTEVVQSPIPSLPSKKELAQWFLAAEEQNEQLRAELAQAQQTLDEQAPKVQFVDEVLASTSTWTTSTIANELGMSAIALNKKLEELGVQYNRDGHWLLTARYQNKSLASTRTHSFTRSTGTPKTNIYTVWTEKGRAFIHSLLNPALQPPVTTAIQVVGIGQPGQA